MEKALNNQISQQIDDQKILINFLNHLKKENLDLENIKDFFELAEIWKTTSFFTDFGKKIDNRMFVVLPSLLKELPLELKLFFPKMEKIIKTITLGSKNQELVLQKITQVVDKAEEADLCLLVSWHQRWNLYEREREILFLKIKKILETKNIEELFEIRVKNDWNKPIIFLIDKILSSSLPNILPSVSSTTFLFSLLEKVDYNCNPKELIESRLVEILEGKFLFSLLSLEEQYQYWKLFSNKSKGRLLFRKAIFESIDYMSLPALFKAMNKVDKMDIEIMRIFYKKISKMILKLRKNDSDYDFFLRILKEDLLKRNIPEELIPVFKKKTEEILFED